MLYFYPRNQVFCSGPKILEEPHRREWPLRNRENISRRGISLRSVPEHIKLDGFVKSQKVALSVIPAKAGIQLFQVVLDPGACPGPDPGFAGVTIQETLYETIKV
jgi:hypothetical protein